MNSQLDITPPSMSQHSRPETTQSIHQFHFTAIINSGSGTGSPEQIRKALENADTPLNITQWVTVEPGDDIVQCMTRTFERAADQQQAVLLIGGDGTISLGIQYALKHQVPIAVMGQGTFNLFARHHRLSLNLSEQVEQLSQCWLRDVPMCWANGVPFATSASFGIYPQIIQDREHYQKRAGFRSRITALLAGIMTFFNHKRRLSVALETEAGVQKTRLMLLMATQNRPQLENFGCEDQADRLDGEFALITIKPKHWKDKLRLFMKGSMKQLANDDHFELRRFQSLTIHSPHSTLQCAIDGEVISLATPVHLHCRARALPVFLPNSLEEH